MCLSQIMSQIFFTPKYKLQKILNDLLALTLSCYLPVQTNYLTNRHKHRSRRQQSDAESELSRGSGRSGRRHRRHRSRHKHESGSERDDSQPDAKLVQKYYRNLKTLEQASFAPASVIGSGEQAVPWLRPVRAENKHKHESGSGEGRLEA